MRAITYAGEVVAIATRARVHLAPAVAALPGADPKLRFVAAMCLYSWDLDRGEVPGPYRADDAELYARCLLLPDDEFRTHQHEADSQLAARFGVPVEQVSAKRVDIETSAGGSAEQTVSGPEQKVGTRLGAPASIGDERRRDERNQPSSSHRRLDP